jgi:hypothetical protein
MERPAAGGLLTAIAVASFHLTEGQTLDSVTPLGALSAAEQRQVAFSAFPDSNSFELHNAAGVVDSSFFFRIARDAGGGEDGEEEEGVERKKEGSSAPASQPRFLYGFVFCRQRRDAALPRGGDQRSVVLLSPLPLTAVLGPLAARAGPRCLAGGVAAAAAALAEVAAWPPLEWGAAGAALPGLAGAPLEADLPDLGALPAAAAAAAVAPAALAEALADELDEAAGLPPALLPPPPGRAPPASAGLFADVGAFTPLAGALPQLWALWEAALCGEPLLVAAPSPAAASAAVAALLSLTAPLPPGADFRPFFTVHDPAFAPLAATGGPPPLGAALPSLLGFTNQLFLRALGAWPNVLATGYSPATAPPSLAASPRASADGEVGVEGVAVGGGPGGKAAVGGGAPSTAARLAGGAAAAGARISGLLALRRPAAGAAALLARPGDGCWLAGFEPALRPDRGVLAALAHVGAGEPAERRRRAAAGNDALLRRHFAELTRNALAPLLPLFTPTPPPEPGAGPGAPRAPPPPPPPLDAAAFLARLPRADAGVPDTFRRRFTSARALARFYGRLLASPGLLEWLEVRRAAAAAWQARAWREARRARAPHAAELAAVSEFQELEARAAGEGEGGGGGGEALAAALRDAFARLPEDVRALLLLSPERAAALQPPAAGAAARPME